MAARKSTTFLVVHVTATKKGIAYSRADIDAMHKALGWSGIGYNGLLLLDGKGVAGRGDDAIGAHVEGFNSIAWGIAMIGGLDARGKPANTMTPAQEAGLERELRAALKKYPGAVICGHRDLSPDIDGDGVIEANEWTKQCPCFNVIPWAKARGLPVASIRGPWDTKAPPKPVGPDQRNVYLQRLLARAGYAFGAIDGFIGPRTVKAVSTYQLSVNLPRTGKFDAATVRKLRAQFEAPAKKAA